MDTDAFRAWSRRAADWGADYRASLRDRPVRAQVRPGDIASRIGRTPPEAAEPMEAIFADFENILVPGMTHWQHPRFFAYFPANAARVSVVAEYLVSAIAAQCMLWQTSPAATELETVTLDWLRQALGLAGGFTGVIQDSASSATLAAVLTMRERALGWRGKSEGLAAHPAVRIYTSAEAHTSIDRAIWIAGIGEENLVRIPAAGERRGMDALALDAAVASDKAAGLLPAGVIANIGGTSVGACDDVAAIAAVAKRHDLYLHVDAAWAGSAMICPEFRGLWAGVDEADSLVLNPHKWLGAQFDCSAHYLKEPENLLKTLAIHPEFLKTHEREGIVDYSEWSIPLGRRFRALKLWFLIRAHGLEGLRAMIRNHVAWAEKLAERLDAEPDFEVTSAPVLSLFSFRYVPEGAADLDALNAELLQRINDDGRIYLTQTKLDGKFVIRFQAGGFATEEADVDLAFDVIRELARRPAG
ncbi:MAG TPA: pyridoxal-dependent decarboxylase [Afifellaceae bacterium]|nr:pyridoxal-dependent decarboxylase [Afifellaceae bacterium]